MNKVFLVLCTVFSFCYADLYLQCLRGSNNRLDEQGRNRHNGNRLFDSQNNNRGGYNVGKMNYFVGETVPICWTNQHSCGNLQMKNCDLIVQYACDAKMRDGTVTRTIPDQPLECRDFNCDTDVKYGRHESYASYQRCKGTMRNTGLFTSGQNLKGTSAKYTRQNPNGARRGYECPEERDYYPYWGASMWKDLAVMTNQSGRCKRYQETSQNVQARGQCKMPQEYIEAKNGRNNRGVIPITQAACEATVVAENEQNVTNAVWETIPAHGIPPPACVEALVTRTNHHGIVQPGMQFYTWNWKVGEDLAGADACAIRMRYNITTADYNAWANDVTVEAGAAQADNALRPCEIDQNKVGNNRNAEATIGTEGSIRERLLANCRTRRNGSIIFKRNLNAGRDPAIGAKVWERVGLTWDDIKTSFANYRPGSNTDLRDPNSNNQNVRAAREASMGFVFRDNPVVAISRDQRTRNNVQTSYMRMRLAINTNQFSRTFQDRTHTFYVSPAPANTAGSKIQLVTVQGKRGNIVQVYPATEYFFIPENPTMKVNEFVHFAWTGSNTNPNNNDGQGKQGTDRSNICPMSADQFTRATNVADKYLYLQDYNGGGQLQVDGDVATLYPAWVTKPGYKDEDWDPNNPRHKVLGAQEGVMGGLATEVLKCLCTQRKCGGTDLSTSAGADETLPVSDDDYGNMEELDDAGTSFALEPVKVTRLGCTNFLSTRNNNFSNRSQKGTFCVREGEVNSAFFPTQSTGILSDEEGKAKLWAQPGVFARAVTIVMENEPSKEPDAASDVYKISGMTEKDLAPGQSYQIRIPMQNEVLTSPELQWKADESSDSWQKVDAEFKEEDGTSYAEANVRSPGLFKVKNEPDTIAIVAISFGCIAFAGVLGAVIFTKCRPKDMSSIAQDSNADL